MMDTTLMSLRVAVYDGLCEALTANKPLIGHKGALWLNLGSYGKAAHGSMPENGVNALYRAGHALSRLEQYRFEATAHPVLGRATLSVGTLKGGSSINVVPDYAEIGVDIRTLPGMDHTEVAQALRAELGSDINESTTVVDLPAVFTAEDDPWIQTVFKITATETKHTPQSIGASYFTDACVLQHAFPGAPTIILGPGEPAMAHQTDEYCRLDRIEEAVRMYAAIICDWCTAQ
jgi:succinyl-diaminopimelate desuccinylase